MRDQEGKPVVGARVWCHLSSAAPKFGAVPSALTDGDGRFSVTGLVLGEYSINPWKEEEGYANHAFALYGDDPDRGGSARVFLTAEAPVADNLILVLGPKAGIIEGSISDAITGKPIAAEIVVSRTDTPRSHGRSAKGIYRFLLPPNKPVTLSARARGYMAWYYPGVPDASHASPVLLNSGDKKIINIVLVPDSQ